MTSQSPRAASPRPEGSSHLMVSCPNCSSRVDREPVHCPVCGYRSEMAAEYLWLYTGGAVVVAVGFVLGALGVVSQGCSPEHWSLRFAGWFPLYPWPADQHWLAFLIAGIALSVAGLGITRHRTVAWAFAFGWSLYGCALVVTAMAGAFAPAATAGPTAAAGTEAASGPGAPTTGALAALLASGVLMALLLGRVGRALRITPRRDVRRLQELAGIVERPEGAGRSLEE